MPQDEIIQLVYRAASRTYYSTTNVREVKLPAKQILFLERLPDFSAYRMVDLHENEYATLEWEEIRGMTWRGNPIVVSANPAPTAKPEDSAFFGEIVNPMGSDPWMGVLAPSSGKFE